MYTNQLISKLDGYDALCILGPTASGKTHTAVIIAQKICGEILSADSRQVYRGMDIGTGKDLNEYGNIPVHLIDIKNAGEKYNIFEYQKDFSKAYQMIKGKGKFPIICGGSGLYIEAATKAYELKEVEPNYALREELEKLTMEELIEKLKKLKLAKGTQPHNNSDFDSKKRIIRAIEIELSNNNNLPDKTLSLPQKTYFIGIDVDRDLRNSRIDARLDARLKEGLIEEVKTLISKGIAPDDLIYYGLEYKYITLYIIGQLSYDQMYSQLKTAIHQFAKRQMTWFRGMERKGCKIEWIEPF